MLVIGVDPGLTGALCLLDSCRGLLECEDIPACPNGQDSGSMKRWVDVDLLEVLLGDWSTRHSFAQESVHAVIERPIPMPTLPAQTIASQFDTFGAIRATLRQHAAMCYVNPREWKRFFGLKTDKDAARACCLRLYPSAPVKRVKDHNRAESVLIGHWLMREIA
jgi:hypothetical protein